MNVEPAHIDQIRQARDGRMILIDADAGGVASDLRSIDPQLRVRFADGPAPFFAVYWESEDRRDTYLVLTARAHLTASGTWGGLDGRIVRRIREIDSQGRSGYNYARELAKQDERAREASKQKFRDRVGETAEMAAHALRKDRGTRYRGRAFIGDKGALQ